jgi:hypothetical protein
MTSEKRGGGEFLPDREVADAEVPPGGLAASVVLC